jgi:AraC family transcriptional regulator
MIDPRVGHFSRPRRSTRKQRQYEQVMTTDFGELHLAQKNGGLPTTLAAGSAPGESGVSVLNVRFQGGMHLKATLRQHLICFQKMDGRPRFECRIADQTLSHTPPTGSLAICSAGTDCAADADGSVDAIFVAIAPAQLALAAAEDQALGARLMECFSGYDQALLDLARRLASESADHYPNGPLFWNEVTSDFLDGLVDRHMSGVACQARGTLGEHVLARLRDYIIAHLEEPIEVAALARQAGRSPFHFTRVFRRSVGISPHRYVVHLRLQRAIALVHDGRLGLAEIAACTGFADQSHLSRWVRRVHGVSLTQLVASPPAKQQQSSRSSALCSSEFRSMEWRTDRVCALRPGEAAT